jgi:small subunit ribosomal protein S16
MLGNYNPRTNPAKLQVDAEQARAWMAKGALPTDTVRSLLKQAGVLGKRPA